MNNTKRENEISFKERAIEIKEIEIFTDTANGENIKIGRIEKQKKIGKINKEVKEG